MTREPRQFARHLCQSATTAEDALWQALRGRKLDGPKFRHQAPFASYTVDFLCFDRKLIVEVDGVQHGWFSEYDERRTRKIEAQGFVVVRATNQEVLTDLDLVLRRISEAAAL